MSGLWLRARRNFACPGFVWSGRFLLKFLYPVAIAEEKIQQDCDHHPRQYTNEINPRQKHYDAEKNVPQGPHLTRLAQPSVPRAVRVLSLPTCGRSACKIGRALEPSTL